MQKHINLSTQQHLFMCRHVLQSANKVYPQKGEKNMEMGICCDYHPRVKGAHPLVWCAPKQPYACSAGMGCAVDGKCRKPACP